ncbi:MAG: transglutaminase-like domain-containing protein [Bacillota bacterium]|jgi:transglutaminase/protease-like cytokinesis protein 3
MKERLWLILIIAVSIIIATSAPALAVGYFNTDNITEGLIHVTCSDGGKVKLMVQKGDKKYTYDVNSAGLRETFPLQLGNGAYKISLLKNTSGNSYKLIASKNLEVNIKDPHAVYLSSIQIIRWNVDSKAVAKAVELTKDTSDLGQKAKILWDYVIKNNTYDYGKLSKLPPGYIPVPDNTFIERRGICYDFASLYAAMLRSQGTPAKLVKGYAPKNVVGYHAWNEVYDVNRGQWIVVDSTYDLQVITRNPGVSMQKNSADFNKVYEY